MKTIYDFEVFLKEEVQEEVKKSRRRKNKETGKMEKYEETVIETVEKLTPKTILIKKPTRTMYEDADLFYSIQFNKYVKMGLLTDSQIAKKQIEVGEGLSEEQFEEYIKLKQTFKQKEEALLRLMVKPEEEKTNEDEEKKTSLLREVSMLEARLESYDRLRVSAYEHTADARSRNDCLLWWCLNLSYIQGEDEEVIPMFEGQDFKDKKARMEEIEDDEDEIYNASYQRISDIVSIFYLMGVSNREEMKKTLKQYDDAQKEGDESEEG